MTLYTRQAQFGSQSGRLPPAAYQQPPAYTSGSGSHEQSPEEAQRLALEAERKKRDYLSLFSSNVSLSFRKDQNAQQPANAPQELALPALQAISAQLNGLRGGLANSAANT